MFEDGDEQCRMWPFSNKALTRNYLYLSSLILSKPGALWLTSHLRVWVLWAFPYPAYRKLELWFLLPNPNIRSVCATASFFFPLPFGSISILVQSVVWIGDFWLFTLILEVLDACDQNGRYLKYFRFCCIYYFSCDRILRDRRDFCRAQIFKNFKHFIYISIRQTFELCKKVFRI